MHKDKNSKSHNNMHNFTGGIRKAAYPKISECEIFFKSTNPVVLKTLDDFFLKHSIVAFKDFDELTIPLKGLHNSYIESMPNLKCTLQKSADSTITIWKLSMSSGKTTLKALMDYFVGHDIIPVASQNKISILLE